MPIIDDIKNLRFAGTKHLKEILYMASGLQLTYFSAEAFKAGPEGFSSLYTGFAISAGVDLTMAIWEALEIFLGEEQNKKKGREALRSADTEYGTMGLAEFGGGLALGVGYRQAKVDAIFNVIARTIAFAGWTAIACGHPFGWALVAASSLYYMYKNRSTYTCGLFFKNSEIDDSVARTELREQCLIM